MAGGVTAIRCGETLRATDACCGLSRAGPAYHRHAVPKGHLAGDNVTIGSGAHVPIYGTFGDVRRLLSFCQRSEQPGSDGFFIWDILDWRRAIVDPWVVFSAWAARTGHFKGWLMQARRVEDFATTGPRTNPEHKPLERHADADTTGWLRLLHHDVDSPSDVDDRIRSGPPRW